MIDVRRGQCFVDGIVLGGQFGKIDVFDLDEQSFRVWVIHQLMEQHPALLVQFQGGQGATLVYRQKNPDIIREARPKQVFDSRERGMPDGS